ncbi:MAG: SET domain-containing protein-lysine N-methyltransferase [Caldilineaceae bacterium]|nr:SET domain-containing protein-lysine N-methyltransferase [Caldilineaceae bacterium]
MHKATAVQRVFELAKQGFDLFINLCDGEWEEDRAGIEVAQALERVGVPFTGANAAFFATNREKLKMACHFWGVKTPASVFVYAEAAIALAARNLRYPMLVKHYNGYGSIGLTQHSRVTDEAALYAQSRQMLATYGGALIEEFIDGREFTVLVAENPDDPTDPIAYLPVEFRFPPGESFKHFGMKWESYVDMACVPVTDPSLSERLAQMGKQVFLGVEGVSYGRCDIRMNEAGELFILEINPNCGVFYPPEAMGSADLALSHDSRGHQHFVDAIIRAAFRRAHKKPKKWQVVLNAAQQVGVYANNAMAVGEIIDELEEQPQLLVSRRQVHTHWNAQRQQWFARYAYPLTDELYVLWSNDPGQWKPLNHSCDPNTWFDGLNLVARRAIAPGEALTIDYGTFHNELMPAFTCSCGAPTCRGLIQGRDYQQPFIAAYGAHVSDYVWQKQQALRHQPEVSHGT